MEKNGRQKNGNVGGQGGSHQHWSAIVSPPPPRLSPTLQVFKQSCNPLFTHCIRCSLKRTTQWLKERNGYIGVALKLCF